MPRSAAWILQAHDGIRTRDLFLTKEVLYRLSYMGPDFISTHGSWHDTDYGAGNGIRTRDPELGRLALYQLSYSRSAIADLVLVERGGFEPPKAYAGRFTVCSLWPLGNLSSHASREAQLASADGENRTRNLLITSQLLYL